MVVREDAEVERYVRSTVERPGHWENISHVVSTYSGPDNWKQNFVWNDEVDGTTMLEQADVLDYDTDMNTSEITRSFYHRNALGSVMEITDMNEAKVASYRYDPYGAMTITVGGTPQSSDPLGQHWGFSGRLLDEESGLHYYRARFYDPETGRFLQRDPLGYAPCPHLYAYVESNPVNRRDPSGLDDEEDKGGAAAKLRSAFAAAEEGYLKDSKKFQAQGKPEDEPGDDDDVRKFAQRLLEELTKEQTAELIQAARDRARRLLGQDDDVGAGGGGGGGGGGGIRLKPLLGMDSLGMKLGGGFETRHGKGEWGLSLRAKFKEDLHKLEFSTPVFELTLTFKFTW